ncbi:hypothetical protein GCQ56_08190 [Marinifilum sp. N1E240]|uniref:hypothetical protein n=1 Tax=Marinifilum sp. N1E240 TaxID=2608082 RepID=UPI00128E39B6|nr:hypothetical protein [Marinifilum sp. N1E240]MPQ46994.1 hypothetical protein [Marinifilum sp. N1E240]
MIKFLRSYYKEIGGLLAFAISIAWVYDRGRDDEQKIRETIIQTQIFQYQKKELKLEDSIKIQSNVIGELQKTITKLNGSDFALKIKKLEFQKADLENEKHEASNTIQNLLDSIKCFSGDKEKIKDLKLKLNLKKTEKDSVDLVLKGTKRELRKYKDTIHSIGQRNIQLSENLAKSKVKYDKLNKCLPFLKEAYFQEKMADKIGNNQKKLECLFNSYEAYELARAQNVFMKTDLWRIIRKINKLDSDHEIWKISNKGFSIRIDRNLYWDLFDHRSVSNKSSKEKVDNG